MALYCNFFNTQTDRECLGAYLWHQTVSASLWPLLSLVEVAFRNRAHYALSTLHGNTPSRAWYGGGRNDMRLKMRIQRRIDDLLNLKDASGAPLVRSIDNFISETTFGLWVEVLYEVAPDRRYRFAKLAFPGYSLLADKTTWVAPQITWMPILSRLERHKSYRDKIAHHGPLWKIPFEPKLGDASILPLSPGALIQSLRKEATALRATLCDMEPGLSDFWDGVPNAAFMTLTTMASLQGHMGRPIPEAPALSDLAHEKIPASN